MAISAGRCPSCGRTYVDQPSHAGPTCAERAWVGTAGLRLSPPVHNSARERFYRSRPAKHQALVCRATHPAMQLYAGLTPTPCTPALLSALMKGGVALPARRSASNANEGARHMNSKHLAVLTLALSATLAAGGAHAGGRPDVQWSVTTRSPRGALVVGAPVYAPPVYAPYCYAPPRLCHPRSCFAN